MACDPGANAFIEKYFADCVYNLRDYIGFCLGITAILFWLVAQVPQYVRNYKTKSADALSPWFLASWLLGDTTNLLGCLLQGQQLPTTTYTAMYFVMADVFMMMQYIYYGALSRRREKLLQLQARRRHHHRRHQHHSSSRSHTPSGSQQRHAAGGSSSSPSRRQPQQDEQRQQQQQQGQRHVTYSIDRDMEYGIGGSSKQQHLQQQDQQPADQQQQEPYISGNCLHTHAAAPCEGGTECSSDGSSSDGSGGGGRAVWRSQDAAPLPASCSAAAAAASSSSRPRLRCGPAVLGSQRSVAGVALLVGLGMVSLLVPASNTRGLFPAGAPAGITGSTAAAAAAHPRNLEAGLPAPSLMHAAGSSSNSSSSSIGTAWGITGGDSPVEPPVRDLAFMVGTALGYCSSVLYLCSRVSQIYKNYCRQSSEGLALAMFMMAVCANLCTGTGIIMRTFTVRELMEQLPWIIGTLGTISLDMVILWQSLRYASKAHLARHATAGGGADGGSSEEQRQLLHAHHHHHQVTVHLHHQPHALPAAGHAAVVGRGNGSSHSRAMAIPAAAADRHIISGDGMNMPHHLSSSAPVMPGWGGALSHRPEAGRRQAVAAAADHVDGADETAPLLRVS
uniref:Uncharacterized protein n=1 Tax=Tetradesmus obliquus TaxID=3088 RepID=A0A383VI65_TETOB|eukprot:jgi/Sobl393_1/788/SZX64529.1